MYFTLKEQLSLDEPHFNSYLCFVRLVATVLELDSTVLDQRERRDMLAYIWIVSLAALYVVFE